MAETRLFQGLITDIGISKAIDTQTVEGWYITPYKFALAETKGEFATNRTTMNTTWYDGYFSAINKIDNDRIQLTLSLDGDEDTIQRRIQEIYVICKTPDGQDFLYALIQPLMDITFTPNVAQEMNFLLRLTNTQGQDVYHIEYIDDTKLNSYQMITEKGKPSGYCPLGANGIVADNYLPNRDNLPIGSIVPILCSANYIPKGYVPCDGSEFTYDQFKEVYEDYLLGGLLPTCTYTEYTNSINTYGSCGKYALDTTQGKFKVPYIKNGTTLQQALSDSEIAKLYNAGLPNVEGNLNSGYGIAWVGISSSDGAFTSSGNAVYDIDAKGGGGNNSTNINFNASRSNSIYGKSNTVQPNAISIRWFVILSHGLVTDSRFTDDDWRVWITQLNKNTTDIATINSFIQPYTTVGQPIICLSDTLPANYIRLEGATVSRVTYSALFGVYGTTYGEGDGSTTFTLPNFTNRTLWGGTNFGYIDAGLPNLYGNFSTNQWGGDGAFLKTSSGGWGGGRSDTKIAGNVNFDASRCNSIYGKSDTVQPPSIKVRVITRYR